MFDAFILAHSTKCYTTVRNELGLVPSDEQQDAIHVTFIDSSGDVYEVTERAFDRIRTSPNGEDDQEVLITLVNDELSVSIDNTPVIENLCMKLSDGSGRGPGFSGNFLNAGFTSSTGLEGDQQEILMWQFQELTPPAGGVSSSPCSVQVRETFAPTFPPVPSPTDRPTSAPTSSAPTPAPPRQARILVTVAGTEELSESAVIAFEQSCSLFLSSQDELPDVTCDIEGQEVLTDSATVILTVLFEAIAPGLDVEVFANLILAALDDPLFTDPNNVIGSGIGEPVLIAAVTLTINNVQNGVLTPEGIAVLEASCREFLTVRVGNPNIRCTVIQLGPAPISMNDGRRQLQEGGASPVLIEQIVNADAPSDPEQPETNSEFSEAVNQAYETDADDFVEDVVERAEESGVDDFTETTEVEVMPNDPLTRFLLNLIPIIMLIIRAFTS